MKAPWKAGVVIKIKNPFHNVCLRANKARGKRDGFILNYLNVAWKTAFAANCIKKGTSHIFEMVIVTICRALKRPCACWLPEYPGKPSAQRPLING
ncbi:MAG: hypothetical protein GQ535_08040 [Rhodobacteraceae bacterium]|nr:hypothetical protein [Paracoccaceae bacterium]